MNKIESAWRSWCYAVGVVIVVAWILGALNVIDFHICIKALGHCKIVDPSEAK